MAKFTTLPSDMKLYSPAEPKGRVFLAGESWPGDAWSDKPGGDEVGRGTVTQSLKDLEAAQKQADSLRSIVDGMTHDLAQIGKERDEALSANAALLARAEAAEALSGAGAEVLTELTQERDSARAAAAAKSARADKLYGDCEEAKSTISRLTAELAAAEQARADARAHMQELETDLANAKAYSDELEKEVAKVDGDGNGKVGGRAKKATPETGDL